MSSLSEYSFLLSNHEINIIIDILISNQNLKNNSLLLSPSLSLLSLMKNRKTSIDTILKDNNIETIFSTEFDSLNKGNSFFILPKNFLLYDIIYIGISYYESYLTILITHHNSYEEIFNKNIEVNSRLELVKYKQMKESFEDYLSICSHENLIFNKGNSLLSNEDTSKRKNSIGTIVNVNNNRRSTILMRIPNENVRLNIETVYLEMERLYFQLKNPIIYQIFKSFLTNKQYISQGMSFIEFCSEFRGYRKIEKVEEVLISFLSSYYDVDTLRLMSCEDVICVENIKNKLKDAINHGMILSDFPFINEIIQYARQKGKSFISITEYMEIFIF